jgi:hypothetical protein
MSFAKILHNLARADYDRMKSRINWSTLKLMSKSPMHYQHALTAESESKDHFNVGNAGHTLILEPEKFSSGYALYTELRNSKKWEAFKEANAGKTILTEDGWATAHEMRDAVARHPLASKMLGVHGHSEVTILWDLQAGPATFEMRARLDRVTDGAIYDIKSTQDASPAGFGRECERFRYHTQASLYRRGAQAVTGKDFEHFIIAVEKKAPFAVAVYRVTEEQLAIGEEEYTTYLAKLDACRQADSWPGYPDEVMDLTLPKWAAKEFELEAA